MDVAGIPAEQLRSRIENDLGGVFRDERGAQPVTQLRKSCLLFVGSFPAFDILCDTH